MKWILVLILASGLFGYEIEFNREFSTKLKPDTLQANINISVKKPSEKEVLGVLGKFGNFISATKDINKSGGNYSIHPNYQYENNRRYRDGYQGNINYLISSKDADRLNKFIVEIESKKRDFGVDISINSVSWIVSEGRFKGVNDGLRLDAINWIESYAKTLSSTSGKTCSTKKISFTTQNKPYPMALPMRMETKMADYAPPTPEVKDRKVTINPHFIMECK